MTKSWISDIQQTLGRSLAELTTSNQPKHFQAGTYSTFSLLFLSTPTTANTFKLFSELVEDFEEN